MKSVFASKATQTDWNDHTIIMMSRTQNPLLFKDSELPKIFVPPSFQRLAKALIWNTLILFLTTIEQFYKNFVVS